MLSGKSRMRLSSSAALGFIFYRGAEKIYVKGWSLSERSHLVVFPIVNSGSAGRPSAGNGHGFRHCHLRGKPVGEAIIYLLDPRLGQAYSPLGVTDGNGRFYIAFPTGCKWNRIAEKFGNDSIITPLILHRRLYSSLVFT
jgi:hypothetical protein